MVNGFAIARGRDMRIELAVWRAGMGLTTAEAAWRLGVEPDILRRWEGGEPVPFPAMIEGAIGVPVGRRRMN